jgi:predicted esterase
MLKVHFIHGLESSPTSRKALVLAEHFDAETPAMDTSDFESCVALHAERLRERRPDVLIGSSFGGAVALALLQRGFWCGPTLLLAQAGIHYGLEPTVPGEATVLLVHATGDDVVAVADSRKVAAVNSSARLLEIEDDHALSTAVAAGKLVDWVLMVADEASAHPPQ